MLIQELTTVPNLCLMLYNGAREEAMDLTYDDRRESIRWVCSIRGARYSLGRYAEGFKEGNFVERFIGSRLLDFLRDGHWMQ